MKTLIVFPDENSLQRYLLQRTVSPEVLSVNVPGRKVFYPGGRMERLVRFGVRPIHLRGETFDILEVAPGVSTGQAQEKFSSFLQGLPDAKS